MAVVALGSMLVGFGLVRLVTPSPAPLVGGFAIDEASLPRVQITREAAVELNVGARVFDAARGTALSAVARSVVRRESRGIRVLSGQVSFEVARRPVADGPVRVLVSGGSIEVHGTRFTVTETGAGRGAVELAEGAIDFIDVAGDVHVLRPGDRASWPVVPAVPVAPVDASAPSGAIPDPVPGPTKPLQRPAPAPAPSDVDWRAFDQRVHAEAVITELTQLRRQGAWADAVRLLERELDGGAPDTREQLSFELGLILTWQVKDVAAACAHWAQHRHDFPEGRFDAEVDRATASLGCAP